MKSCPACGNQYSDETLRFCLQDGSPLTGGSEAETPTVFMGETETVAARRDYGRVNVPVVEPGSGQWQESRVTQLATAPKRGSAAKLIVAVFGGLLLLALGVVGVSLILLYANRPVPPANNGNNANIAAPNIASNDDSFETPTPSQTFRSPTPGPSAIPTVAANIVPPTAPVDGDRLRGEVSRQVYSWKSLAESRDLNSYMGNYASSLDYYLRRNVSAGTVRADKARAFSLYSSIRIDISNMVVAIGPTGETATATFDKEWLFDGRDRSQGKVRSQLKFVRSGSRWLITSERDLKLYYKR